MTVRFVGLLYRSADKKLPVLQILDLVGSAAKIGSEPKLTDAVASTILQ